MLLGGYNLDDERKFRQLFVQFWHRFRFCRPDLDLYKQEFAHDLSLCIPVAYHGDEGRGKMKRPLMVLAFQPLISHMGPEYTNANGILGYV